MNQFNYPTLNDMIEKRGIKRNVMAKTIGVTEKTLRNKLQGKSKFDVDEVVLIQETHFPDISIEVLFEKTRPAL